MSVFSELLKTHIENCGITVVSLAKQCGIDRTMLHKIISGERKPPSHEFVIKLSRVLMLSAAERSRLTEQYEISLVGDELYKRRRNVTEMIRKLSILGRSASFDPQDFYRIKSSDVKEHSTYYTRLELLRAGYSLLVSELESGEDIDIVAQPTDDVCQFLKYASAYYCGSRIRHIFCLDNGSGSGEANDYNLGLCPGVCELTYLYSGYIPLYYYECVDSHINSATMLPFVIVGRSFVMCADNELETGMIFRVPDIVSYYSGKVERLKDMCYVFIERMNNAAGMVGNGSSYHDYSLTLDKQPSLVLVSTEKEIRENMLLPEEHLEMFVERVKYLQKRYYKRDYMVIFSTEGLGIFMKTGIVAELPEKRCSPLPPETRIKMLAEMIEKSEKGIYDFRLIETSSSPSEKLRINLDTDGAVHLILRSEGNYVFMTLGEQSLRTAMHDYFSNLIETGKVFSRERSVAIMREVLAAAAAELSGDGSAE